ncbi:2Fe-2S iron-sulfur cluster-binding protein [Roseovarius sp. CH_XMU1461]|uniref:2Fe-2S iron-sulfur cluster-binding protein n=1 Tax=Roseovarius sp. CH_XMU1461 TaxID=3107777 RepID=UPI00300837A7
MTKIHFQHPDGSVTEIEGTDGDSVMQTALDNDVDGIVAECGGSAMCATCHVYVVPEWRDKLPAMNETEDAMLESASEERTEGSRLSCQIPLSPDLNGLRVILPATQV